jgi:release factor glutamine methyltransferase
MYSSKFIFTELVNKLKSHFQYNEAKSIVFLLLEEFLNLSKTDILIDKKIDFIIDFEPFIKRLLNYEPIQYIIGKTQFFDYDFIVKKNVTLIPRPETEELVLLCINKLIGYKEGRILDVGTGTGCIPISIAKQFSNFLFDAWDVSQEALDVAKLNANLNNVVVNFQQVDILNFEAIEDNVYDLIVSNPPYVSAKEKEFMDANVVNFEPHIALFVDNDNPLIFYRKIAKDSLALLKAGGWLIFEINENFANETAELLFNFGYVNIDIISDINHKSRFVCCQR